MKKLIIWIPLFLAVLNARPQIAINRDGSPPDNSAMLELKSDSLGFLPPRMTSQQRDNIQGAVPGMIIYNITTHSLETVTSSDNGTPTWTSVSEEGIKKKYQPFQVIYGDTMADAFKDVIQTGDGGYLAAGTIQIYDDFYLGHTFNYLVAVKLKADGTLDENFNYLNDTSYGSFICCYLNGQDLNNGNGKASYKSGYGESVIETHNRNYLITGRYESSSGSGSQRSNFLLVKLTPKGKPDKDGLGSSGIMGFGCNEISSDQGWQAVETLDGGFAVCGRPSNWSYGFGAGDAQIVKFNPHNVPDANFNAGYGNIIIGTNNQDAFYGMLQNPDSSYIAVGGINIGGTSELLIAKFKPDGIPDSSFHNTGKLIIKGQVNHSFLAQKVARIDTNFYVAGYCSPVAGQCNVHDAFVLKVTASGNVDTNFADNGFLIFGAPDDSCYHTYCYSIVTTDDNKFVIAGTTHYTNQSNPCDAFVAKFNTDGTLDNNFGYNGVLTVGTDTTREIFYSVNRTDDGGFIAAGSTTIFQSNGNSSGFIVKISANGRVCANGSRGGIIQTGIVYFTDDDNTSLDKGGQTSSSEPNEYHLGSFRKICNQN